jgi:hypothetical protein
MPCGSPSGAGAGRTPGELPSNDVEGRPVMMISRSIVRAIALFALFALPVGASAQTVIDDWSSATPPPVPTLKDVHLDPKKSVLIIADFNKKSCTPAGRPRCAAALPKIRAFLAAARGNGMMVVHFYNGVMTCRRRSTNSSATISPRRSRIVGSIRSC